MHGSAPAYEVLEEVGCGEKMKSCATVDMSAAEAEMSRVHHEAIVAKSSSLIARTTMTFN